MRKVLYLMGIMNDADVEWMANAGQVQLVASGTELIRQGVPTEWLHVVLEGRLAVMLDGGAELARLGQGEVLGEISFLDSRPPSASVVAIEQSYVLALRREAVSEKLLTDLGFAARFYHGVGTFLADRLRATSSQFGYLRKSAGARAPLASEGVDRADELDDAWTEQVSFAAARFDRLLRKLEKVS